VTPEARRRAAFELLRFTAAPVSGELVVVELEGRFAQSGRFARQPVLVVEDEHDGDGDGRGRLELAPVRVTLAGDRWRSVYALPARALDGGRFALGIRGTLLDLPAPDLPDEGDRFAALAREANRLRRALETAEAEAVAAREAAVAAAAELDAATSAAGDAARAESAERMAALEREIVEAHRVAAADAQRAREESAAERAAALADRDAALTGLRERAEADRHAALAEPLQRAEAAERRAEAAEGRADVAEARADVAEARAEDAAARAEDAELRARLAEEVGGAAGAGTDVLRAELAEERERSQSVIAELQQRLEAAQASDDSPGGDADHETMIAPPRPGGSDPTVALPRGVPAPGPDPGADPPTGPDVATPAVRRSRQSEPPGGGHAEPVRHAEPSPSRWVAVAALLLFAFVLLGLLLGFLG
jgi:hypothetical protein